MTTSHSQSQALIKHVIHVLMQGKGGVGKSLAAAILIQYLRSLGRTVNPIDTDPVNQTLAQYPHLGAQKLELMHEGTIDTRQFDSLMEQVINEENADFVIDNGASSFIPLWHYMIDNNVLALLKSNKRRIVLHTVLTGGQALQDTLKGFETLANAVDDEPMLVVWLNEFFGPIRTEQDQHFLRTSLYKQTQHKILGVVAIPKRNPDTFGRDMQDMLSDKMTFQEAINNGHFSIMAKQRLKLVQKNLFEQLANIEL